MTASLLRFGLVVTLALGAVGSGPLLGQAAQPSDGVDVLISTGEPFPHVEPHLAVHPGHPNRLVVAAMTLPKEGDGFHARVYRSTDGGESWSSHPIEGERDGSQDDPWLAYGGDGSLYLVHLPGIVRRSEDGGRTWRAPIRLPTGGGGHLDAPKMAVNPGSGDRPERIYVAATQTLELQDEGPVRVLAIHRSADRGDTFEGPVRVMANDFKNKSGDLVVLSDGTVVATFHELFHGADPVESPRLWSVRSRNGGRSLSTPSLVTSGFVSLSPMLAVDRSGPRPDRVYAAWLGLEGDRNHYLAHSDDAGVTWSEPVPFAERADSTAHPTSAAIAVGPGGTVGLLWPENLLARGADCFELRFSASRDGGETFTEPIAVSDEPYCSDTPSNRAVMHDDGPRGATVADRFEAGGDYYGLVALPNGAFQAVWADARTGVFQLWTDRVRVNRSPER